MAGPSELKRLMLELTDAQIEFVVVGGLAAVLHGVPIATFDLDIVHSRSVENVERLCKVLSTLDASSRLHPESAHLVPGPDVLQGPGHALLRTRLGPLDLLGSVEGGLTFEELATQSVVFEVDGRSLRVLSLQALADLKAGAIRPKDQLSRLLILETLRLQGDGATSDD